ncbi:hypothetical protein [Photorhabdus hainanensis]|uniref:hypothetical protein n=1 Tax=Photorhabdus hainanensis TaxID=1004166 RepID=UPI001BD3879A|nr:hypothetical protein [Photorhabdus hainanensis]
MVTRWRSTLLHVRLRENLWVRSSQATRPYNYRNHDLGGLALSVDAAIILKMTDMEHIFN